MLNEISLYLVNPDNNPILHTYIDVIGFLRTHHQRCSAGLRAEAPLVISNQQLQQRYNVTLALPEAAESSAIDNRGAVKQKKHRSGKHKTPVLNQSIAHYVIIETRYEESCVRTLICLEDLYAYGFFVDNQFIKISPLQYGEKGDGFKHMGFSISNLAGKLRNLLPSNLIAIDGTVVAMAMFFSEAARFEIMEQTYLRMGEGVSLSSQFLEPAAFRYAKELIFNNWKHLGKGTPVLNEQIHVIKQKYAFNSREYLFLDAWLRYAEGKMSLEEEQQLSANMLALEQEVTNEQPNTESANDDSSLADCLIFLGIVAIGGLAYWMSTKENKTTFVATENITPINSLLEISRQAMDEELKNVMEAEEVDSDDDLLELEELGELEELNSDTCDGNMENAFIGSPTQSALRACSQFSSPPNSPPTSPATQTFYPFPSRSK